jgi:hypothetical protein
LVLVSWTNEREPSGWYDKTLSSFITHTHTRYPRGGGIGGSKKKEEE